MLYKLFIINVKYYNISYNEQKDKRIYLFFALISDLGFIDINSTNI